MATISSEAEPYRFAGSGLGNVYLVGVECEEASIPGVPRLMEAIGRALALKKTPLTPEEVRFLRTRLALPSKRYARILGLSSETYSRIEHGAARITPTVERVIRLLYATLAPLSEVDSIRVAGMGWAAEGKPEQRILGCWSEAEGWTVSWQGED